VICTRCHGSGREPDEIAELAAWLERRGHRIDLDGTVDSRAAADALNCAPSTLRSRRCYFASPPYVLRNGRARYRVADLAAWRARTFA
jgi:hypothetical protein